jgi:hypothetical protein
MQLSGPVRLRQVPATTIGIATHVAHMRTAHITLEAL